jgi:hypothetical protein
VALRQSRRFVFSVISQFVNLFGGKSDDLWHADATLHLQLTEPIGLAAREIELGALP